MEKAPRRGKTTPREYLLLLRLLRVLRLNDRDHLRLLRLVLLRGDAAARGVHQRGHRARALGPDLEADFFERRVELRVEAAEGVAHLRGPLVEDAELDRLLPPVLVGVERALLELDGEALDLALRVFFFLLGLGLGRRRRLAQRFAEVLEGVAGLVERGGRPLGDAERDDVEEDRRRLLQQVGLLLEAFSELFDVALDLDLIELRQHAL